MRCRVSLAIDEVHTSVRRCGMSDHILAVPVEEPITAAPLLAIAYNVVSYFITK
jgi:hypothetical protein